MTFRATLTTLDGRTSTAESAPQTIAVTPPELASPKYDQAIIHYRRTDGDYGNAAGCWGVHVWGESVEKETAWEAPVCMTGETDFGRFAVVDLASTVAPVNFIVHTPEGDTVGVDREPGGDRSFDAAEHPQIWLVEGDENVYLANPALSADASRLRLHYRHPAGDHEGWGLHLWGDVAEAALAGIAWETPLQPVRQDAFGLVFEVPLTEAAESIGYIVHRGDEKDPDGDLGLDFAADGYEVWQRQGASVESPHVLPL